MPKHSNLIDPRRALVIGELLVIYYLPIVLIYIGVIPFAFRFQLLVTLTFIAAILSIVRRYPAASLGLRVDTLRGSLVANGFLCALLISAILVSVHLRLFRQATLPTWTLFYYFYVFISSPAQEFLYRSYLFRRLDDAGFHTPGPQIAIASVTYAFLHIIYADITTLVITLCMGIIWGLIYRRWPNLIGVTISHAVLGVVSIALQLI